MRGPGVVFCGNLPTDVKEKEIDDLFYKARTQWWRGQAQPAAGKPESRKAGTGMLSRTLAGLPWMLGTCAGGSLTWTAGTLWC
jgi:hypothetical protein